MNWTLARSKLPLGVGYFVAASLVLSLMRYEGGVAFAWVAGALLIADLMRAPRSRWLYSIAPCMVASLAATSLFGLGWKVAPFFVLLNAAEAATAAWLFRRQGRRNRMLGSLPSLWRFVFAAGIVAPLVAAAIVGLIFWGMGRPMVAPMIDVATGHALGNLTVTPLALMFVRGHKVRRLAAAGRVKITESVALLLFMAGVSAVVFLQKSMPLLFLPILPIIMIAFRVGSAPTIVALVLLTLIGGTATVCGSGPVSLFAASFVQQLQFFQFYLAVAALTVLPVAADLENRRLIDRNLRISEERYRLLAEHSTDIVMHLELNGRIRYASPSIRQLGGHDPAALIGRNSTVLIAPEHREQVAEEFAATIAAGGTIHTYEQLAFTGDGSIRWFETTARAILDEEGAVESVLTIARDISARKAIERRLTADALTDPLTGLHNRRAFNALAARRPRDAMNDRSDCVAVLDLDHFKIINDSFGHAVGDGVLRDFAKLARRMVREGDFVARIGGEEFAIFFPDTAVDQALFVCNRLRIEMAQTDIRAGSRTVRVTVSGGVGRIGPQGVEHALNVADIALYEAKRKGRDQFALAA